MSVGVIIPAAGQGKRMGTAIPKQFLSLGDRPILVHTLQVFELHPEIDQVVIATGEDDKQDVWKLVKQYQLSKVVAVVTGGVERQDSVRHALNQLQTDWVLVHDAVRPFVSSEQISVLLKEVRTHGAAVLAVPIKDTVKQVGKNGLVETTPDRSRLWAVQTPQAFWRALLQKAHHEAVQHKVVGTDDAMLVERMGLPVQVVMGEYTNIKLTTPEDLILAESFLEKLKPVLPVKEKDDFIL